MATKAWDAAKARPGSARQVPLSIGQERLLRLARMSDAPLYNVTTAFRLRGPLDREALARAVNSIARRHEPLRATFVQIGTEAVCEISDAPHESNFEVTDLRDGLPPEREARLARLLADEAAQFFDLSEGPLWRVHVARLVEDEHALILTMHHIVTDGWSFALLLKELQSSYLASLAGRNDDDPLPEIPYSEFGARHRALVESESVAQQLAYWAERFAHPPETMRLPGVRAETSRDRTCTIEPIDTPEALGGALTAFCQRERLSLFMPLLAAFSAMIAAATGQRDLLIATPVTGRHYAKTRNLIGYFNNILPLRLEIAADPTLGDVLEEVRKRALEAFKNQDAPFQSIAHLPAAGLAGLRLLFSLDMPWPPDFALDGIACEPIAVDPGAADFDLGVSLWVRDGRVFGSLRYKTALFDADAMRAIAATFPAVIEQIVGESATRLSEVRLDPAITRAYNDTPRPAAPSLPRVETLPRDSLELQVARTWESALGLDSINVREDLASLGVSSIAAADLAERIERDFQIQLPFGALFHADTIEKMAAMLRSNDVPAAFSPLAPIRASGSKTPLFLCEGVGIYYALAARLGEDQPVYGLYQEIQSDYPSVREIAERYVDAIMEVQPAGPYQLGGASFGGLVAFETAQQLKARGQQVSLLVLFDTPGPGAFALHKPVRRIIGHLRNVLRYGPAYIDKRLTARRAGRAARLQPETAADARNALRGQIRDLFQRTAAGYAMERYAGRIDLFLLAKRTAMNDSLFDPVLGKVDPYLGWAAVAEQVERHWLPGEHITILQEPNVARLVETLKLSLA